MEAVKKNPLSMQIDPALFEPATEDEKQQQDEQEPLGIPVLTGRAGVYRSGR